ncbi:non-histone chromosomal protein HMG-17 isoform X3 [Hemicordylus capensis]|uniref:non-histone chromosomal protein HMG-17 isoform X3 n=1 Tax=Hemicordylus capensis TaxID=884348 RepID=UPI0023030B56|nr:non-histone chromosomal protein HMG-17 isoform X3 [Hemicordylus capensis]XP_053124061.1 non-histone chromosomal protein HMG-17 isoform X3 [Hemicordylus capensis]
MSHSGDQQGYLLNLLLPNQNLNLKRQLQRRLKRYPKEKRGKLMQARMETTLQKMEMPKQTRHRKLKVLGMPSELCEFLITVYFW